MTDVLNPNQDTYAAWHPSGTGYRNSKDNPYLSAINDILLMHGKEGAYGADWSSVDTDLPGTPSKFRTVVRKNTEDGDSLRLYIHDGSTWLVIGDTDNDLSNYLLIADIDDSPVDEEINAPISSSWAFDHKENSSAHHTLYVHPITAGNKHIPSGGAANQMLKYSAAGIAVWSSTWTGTAIASQYLDVKTAHLDVTQTFTGLKTFNAKLTVGAYDFQVDGGLLFVDASLNKVGINDNSPDYTLDVVNNTADALINIDNTSSSTSISNRGLRISAGGYHNDLSQTNLQVRNRNKNTAIFEVIARGTRSDGGLLRWFNYPTTTSSGSSVQMGNSGFGANYLCVYTSSQRYKTDEVEFSLDEAKKLLNVPTWDFREIDTDIRNIGFFAEQVAEQIPMLGTYEYPTKEIEVIRKYTVKDEDGNRIEKEAIELEIVEDRELPKRVVHYQDGGVLAIHNMILKDHEDTIIDLLIRIAVLEGK